MSAASRSFTDVEIEKILRSGVKSPALPGIGNGRWPLQGSPPKFAQSGDKTAAGKHAVVMQKSGGGQRKLFESDCLTPRSFQSMNNELVPPAFDEPPGPPDAGK